MAIIMDTTTGMGMVKRRMVMGIILNHETIIFIVQSMQVRVKHEVYFFADSSRLILGEIFIELSQFN